jgi:ATP-dependent RNA helicase DDX42
MNPFGDDDENRVKQVELVPAQISGDDDVDPLDAFMADLAQTKEPVAEQRQYIFEDESEDEEFMANISSSVFNAEELEEDADSHGPKRTIETIAPFDHSGMTYAPFKKDLYHEHASISELDVSDISGMRENMGISVTGRAIQKCVCSFAHLNLPESILTVIRYLEFSTPTPIQSQAIPCLLSGRDVIGIAMTGSGKTMAYLIPAIVHVLENEKQSDPRVLIVCPTRELAIQIEQETYRFVRKQNRLISSIALTGGLSKYEQFKEMKKGVDIIVGNPGRVLDLCQMKKGLDISHVTYCVLDEADRMFKMGFENQVRSIIQRIRPDRQISVFSATMPPRIERMCREILLDPIRIVVGTIGQASSMIDQNVFIAHSSEEKFVWLTSIFPTLIGSPSSRIIIFVNSKTMIEEVIERIRQITPINVCGLSSDMQQHERMQVVADFKSGALPILVATDVAARGIDIPGITCVIEFEAARDFDTHTHRIGRTGRAGLFGTSWTLIGKNESKLAAHIVESIEALGIKHVPEELMALALTHAPFKASRTIHNPSQVSQVPREDNWNGLESHFVKKARLDSGKESQNSSE